MPGSFGSGNWNEYNLNPLTRNNLRASLVPAAAVIPAQVAYIKFVAVKQLVVESGFWMVRSASLHVSCWLGPFYLGERGCYGVKSVVFAGTRSIYFEKIRVFKAG